jgi:hypothetical protein
MLGRTIEIWSGARLVIRLDPEHRNYLAGPAAR